MRFALIGSLVCLQLGVISDATQVFAEEASSSHKAVATTLHIPVEKYVLKNGLEVILSEAHQIPVVHVQVWYHVGSKDEPKGKTGFAHLFEHMMFQGSRHIAEDTWFKKLDAAGAYFINGTTNNDRTNYFETVPRHQLGLAIWMESDRMGFLLDHVNQASLANQKDVVRNERRQSYEMRPYGMVEKVVEEALHPEGHPYHHTVIGEHEDLVAATLEDVRGFFKTYYTPANATIAIVGDIDVAQTKQLVERYFSTLPSRPRPALVPPPPIPAQPARTVAMEAGVELPRLFWIWPTVAPWDPDEAALDILSMVLGHGKASRLHDKLVYREQLAQDVDVSNETRQWGGEFVIDAMVRPKSGSSLSEVATVLDEELKRVRTKPVSAEELARAKVQMRARLLSGLEMLHGRASLLQAANHYRGDPSLVSKELERYEAVTAAQVLDVAKRYLPPEHRLTVSVVPNPKAPISGQVIAASAPENRPAAQGGAQ